MEEERVTGPTSRHEVPAGLSVAGSVSTGASFEEIFFAHYDRILALLVRLVGDYARAEELADDVFWKLHQRPLPPDREHNLGGWLYRTATNLGIDFLRASARRESYESEAWRTRLASASLADRDPLEDLLRNERVRRVRSVLAELKPDHARILILRHSGWSYRELADALRVRQNSIGTRLARAEAEFEKRYRENFLEKE